MLRFIFKTEKKEVLENLKYYGIKEIPYLLTISGKDKVRAYSGDLSNEEIVEFDKQVGIELLGMYFFHLYDNQIRLSFDAVQLLKNQITENVIEIDEKQAVEFFRGQDILLDEKDKEKFKGETLGFKVIKFSNDLIGTGKLTADRIVNYLPKERRVK